MRISILIAPLVLVGQVACTAPRVPETDVIKIPANLNTIHTAADYLYYDEVKERQEIKDFTGVDPVRTEWCAAFLNAVLEESGVPSLNTIEHAYPLTARGYLDWGVEVEYPLPGDVVVFPRGNQGWQGHVGLFIEHREINGVLYYMILGGNQSNRVSIEAYRADSAIGIRRHIEKEGWWQQSLLP